MEKELTTEQEDMILQVKIKEEELLRFVEKIYQHPEVDRFYMFSSIHNVKTLALFLVKAIQNQPRMKLPGDPEPDQQPPPG